MGAKAPDTGSGTAAKRADAVGRADAVAGKGAYEFEARFDALLTPPAYHAAWRYAYYLAPVYEDAQDLLQESLAHAYLRVGQLRDTARFTPWLLRIIRTQHLMALRRAKRRPSPLPLAPSAQQPSDPPAPRPSAPSAPSPSPPSALQTPSTLSTPPPAAGPHSPVPAAHPPATATPRPAAHFAHPAPSAQLSPQSPVTSGLNQYIEIESYSHDPVSACLYAALPPQLAAAVLGLAPALREAVELHYLHQLSVTDTARVLGIGLSAAKLRLHRARLILRRALQPDAAGRLRQHERGE